MSNSQANNHPEKDFGVNKSHSHHNHHNHHHQHTSDGNILTAFFLNLFFVFVEVIGGLLTNSFAILSDAIHDFGDCVAIGFAYFMERFSKKTPDDKYTYGYRRYSLLSAIITSGILIVGSIVILAGSAKRLSNPETIHSFGMVIIAVFGVVVNGIAVFKTHKGTGVNERAISLHLIEDVLGWVAVLVGSLFIYLFKWYFIDSLLSVLIAGFLLFESTRNIKEIFTILLEKTPEDINVGAFKESINEIDGVDNVHHLRIWSLDGEINMATMHVGLKEGATIDTYKSVSGSIRRVSKRFGIEHLTVQIEFADGACS